MSQIASIQIAPQRLGIDALIRLGNNRSLQLMTLLVYAFALNREGVRVPSGNELVYLLYIYKAWHPHFMAGDWTFIEPTAGHGFFNLCTGWLTWLMSLQSAAWVGRFTCWILSFIGLQCLGRHFAIPSWGVWLGLLLWMIERQALPTTPWTEWIIGSFEAKCPAYICLIFALDAVLTERMILAGLLAGLAFSFHSAVGLWGGMSIGWAILSQVQSRQDLRRLLGFCVATMCAALPGLLSSLQLIFGSHAITADESRFLVTQAEPLCLDPFRLSVPYVALLLLMFGFGALYRRLRDGHRAALLFQFQLALLACFTLGFAARAGGRFDLVKLFPMRVFAVVTPLFFFWQFCWLSMRILKIRRKCDGPLIATAAYGLVVLLALPSPVARLAGSFASHLHTAAMLNAQAAPPPDADLECATDFRNAADWIATNTPETDLVIAPPWRADAFYFIRRPLIANWHAYRYDAMGEWRKRIELLAGDVSHLDADDADVGDMDLAARSHYRTLNLQAIRELQDQFGAKWLITTGTYPYTRSFQSGRLKVFRLPISVEPFPPR